MDKKQRLIEALRTERNDFAKRGHETLEHFLVIEYLRTGKTTESPDDYDMLDAAMNSFDSLCADYGIK